MSNLITIIAEIFEISQDQITDESSSDNIETWDSFNTLVLVSALEDNYNIKLAMADVTAMKTVKDIKNILKKHNIENSE